MKERIRIPSDLDSLSDQDKIALIEYEVTGWHFNTYANIINILYVNAAISEFEISVLNVESGFNTPNEEQLIFIGHQATDKLRIILKDTINELEKTGKKLHASQLRDRVRLSYLQNLMR